MRLRLLSSRLARANPWLLAFALMQTSAMASTCPTERRAQSGASVVSILELYTSEGCDSCPPADRWLSTFSPQPSATQAFIPLAFHVDYWDYIGWRDPFASVAYSERQRAMVRAANKRTVYTPQVFINGRDQAMWHDTRGLRAAIQTENKPASVSLELVLRADGNLLQLRASAQRGLVGAAGSKIHFAVTERALSSNVTAGENRGVRLQHAHVVRYFSTPLTSSANGEAVMTIPLKPDWKRQDLAAIAIAQSAEGAHLQAVSVALCN